MRCLGLGGPGHNRGGDATLEVGEGRGVRGDGGITRGEINGEPFNLGIGGGCRAESGLHPSLMSLRRLEKGERLGNEIGELHLSLIPRIGHYDSTGSLSVSSQSAVMTSSRPLFWASTARKVWPCISPASMAPRDAVTNA